MIIILIRPTVIVIVIINDNDMNCMSINSKNDDKMHSKTTDSENNNTARPKDAKDYDRHDKSNNYHHLSTIINKHHLIFTIITTITRY